MLRHRSIIRYAAIHLSLAIAAGAGEHSFTFYDIGYLGLPHGTEATDVNDLGIVAGWSAGWHAVFPSAITWENGVITDHTESIPGGWLKSIRGISERGPMVGGALGQNAGALWRDGVGYLADIPPGCEDNDNLDAINDSGTIAVGNCGADNELNKPIPAVYFTDTGSALALGFLPDAPEDAWGYAVGVNDGGIVVGWFSDGRAFSWQDGEMAEIPNLLGATFITARAINNAGLVVGNATDAPNGNVATSYDMNTGIMTDLGLGTAKAVNERGHAVGSSGPHAMLYKDAEVIDLHELVLEESFDFWTIAAGINNHGWIVGSGASLDNESHGWLLIPNHPKGDFDGDGDVDFQDSGHFQRCFAAEPYIDGTLHVGCSVFDFDDDIDLDLDDYAAFQSAFTGPGGVE